ncbi:hypothetical protein KM043_016378 [Ampulex compressa]|nr:hypothetical protein KM043_016378 [Ampulex compressa]
MANDNDIDSRHEWKRGEGRTEFFCDNVPKGIKSTGAFSFDRSIVSSSSEKIDRTRYQPNGLVQCSAKPKSSRSGAEIRFINPAIYAESLDNDDKECEFKVQVKVHSKHDVKGSVCNQQMTETNCGDSKAMTNMLSSLSINNDLANSIDYMGDRIQDTYRCYSISSPSTTSPLESSTMRSKSLMSSQPTVRYERRCRIGDAVYVDDSLCDEKKIPPEIQRYTLNGHRVVQVSATSFSSTSLSENRFSITRKIAHEEWIRKKQRVWQQKREQEELKERNKQAEEERLECQRKERECKERENFLRWVERKKKEEVERKIALEKEADLEKRLKEIESKAAVGKALHLRQWARKKKEEQKAQQRKQELRQREIEEERKKRLEENTKAYEKWREMSKGKPKPATQGLLPHQSAKPAYVNPMPWQSIVVDDSDNVENNARKVEKNRMIKGKTSTRKSVATHQ